MQPSILFAHLLDSQPVGMAVYDHRGQCIYCNKQAYTAQMHTEEAYKGITIFELFPQQADLKLRFNQLTHGELDAVAFDVQENDRSFNVSLSADDAYVFAALIEITAQEQLKQALSDSQQNVKRLDDAMKGANIGCWDYFPKEGKIIANKAWVTQKKYEDKAFRKDDALFSEVVDGLQRWAEMIHPDDLDATSEIIQKHLDGETEVYEARFRMKCGDGEWRWIHDRGKVFEKDADGSAVRMNGVHIDITESKQLENYIIQLLNTDTLTNVKSRHSFEMHVSRMLNDSRRENNHLAFLLLDIDHFKRFNDTYGHLEGDRSLTALGSAINASLRRGGDTCFRIGGEEFAVVYKVDSKATALSLAKTIKDNIEGLKIPHEHNTASAYLTVSMGLWCDQVTEEIAVDEMYNFADKLLYQAKLAGRNSIKAS